MEGGGYTKCSSLASSHRSSRSGKTRSRHGGSHGGASRRSRSSMHSSLSSDSRGRRIQLGLVQEDYKRQHAAALAMAVSSPRVCVSDIRGYLSATLEEDLECGSPRTWRVESSSSSAAAAPSVVSAAGADLAEVRQRLRPAISAMASHDGAVPRTQQLPGRPVPKRGPRAVPLAIDAHGEWHSTALPSIPQSPTLCGRSSGFDSPTCRRKNPDDSGASPGRGSPLIRACSPRGTPPPPASLGHGPRAAPLASAACPVTSSAQRESGKLPISGAHGAHGTHGTHSRTSSCPSISSGEIDEDPTADDETAGDE